MNPFGKLVGFRPVTRSAHFLVNDLPGISDEMGSALVKSEDLSDFDEPGKEGLASLWKRISGLAYAGFLLDLECRLSEKGAFRHELAFTKPLALGSRILSAGTEYDYCIVLPALRFTKFMINVITVHPAEPGQVVLKLLDKPFAKSLYEVKYEIVEGITDLDFPVELPNDRGLNLRLQISSTVDLNGFTGPISVDSDAHLAAALGVEDSSTGKTVIDPFMDASLKLSGDLSALVVRNAQMLAPAFQYACGYQFMKEKLSSNNFNVFTNTNRLITEDNRDAYQKQYKEFLTRGAALIAKQLENSYTLEATPDETGGWSMGSIV